MNNVVSVFENGYCGVGTQDIMAAKLISRCLEQKLGHKLQFKTSAGAIFMRFKAKSAIGCKNTVGQCIHGKSLNAMKKKGRK